MFNSQKLILLCDTKTAQDPETGDRKRVVENVRKIIGKKNLVGVQTQQLGRLQNMNFQYSVEVDKMFYNEQKYLYMDDKLYEIKALPPARLEKDCKLNVVRLEDKDVERAIKEYLSK